MTSKERDQMIESALSGTDQLAFLQDFAADAEIPIHRTLVHFLNYVSHMLNKHDNCARVSTYLKTINRNN